MLKSVADNVGTVMRDLDASDLISGDFLLMSGDVISNMNLEPALVAHRARREKDKNAIMTMILRESGAEHRFNSKNSRPVFAIDPRAERCLYYDEIRRRKNGIRQFTLDPELFKESLEINVRDDLVDCHIDICTQDVLAAWSDNFDFTSLRRSFLRGVLKDYETYGKTVYTYIVTDEYAARVESLRAYDATTRDVRQRWTYPLCPDGNLLPGQCYQYVQGGNYCEDGLEIARTAVVRKSVVGNGTLVGDDSRILGSTVGRRCRIGRNVVIDGTYIWDDVYIEDNVNIRQAIIADNAVSSVRCTVELGTLISYKEHFDDRSTNTQEHDTRRQSQSVYVKDLGDEDSDASSLASTRLVYVNSSRSSSASSISTLASSSTDFDSAGDRSRRSSFRSDPSEDAGENRDFHVEATSSVLDGLQNNDPPDTIMLELSGYRMSTNASQHEVRKAVVTALMKRISSLINGNAVSRVIMSPREAISSVFTAYKTLVERTMFDKDADVKADQVDFLMLVQKEALGRPNSDQILLFIVKEASDLQILETDGILQWWGDKRSSEGEMGKVRRTTEPLVEYLQDEQEGEEGEEEEEEEEEDDDDDDGDDDESDGDDEDKEEEED